MSFIASLGLICLVGCDSVPKVYRQYPNRVQLLSSVPQAVRDDVQTYIETAHLTSDVGWINYLEDGTGKHAVVIEKKPQGYDIKNYVLYYDTNNVRVRVSRYTGHISRW